VRSNLATGFAGFRIGVRIDDADVRAGVKALRRDRTPPPSASSYGRGRARRVAAARRAHTLRTLRDGREGV
jgi:hypothetical protein